MTDPARKPEPPEELLDTEEDEAWAFEEVIQTRQFQIPAAIGLGVSVAALLTDSPYAWVVTFGYLMLGLPGLILYLRERPRPEQDQSWRRQTVETASDRAVCAKLRTFLDGRFLHSEEVERALAQYESAFAAYRELLARARGADSREVVEGRKRLAEIVTRLSKSAQIFSQLAAVDSQQLIRRIQALGSKSNPNDYDRSELQALHDKIELRERMLSDLIDQLRFNDKLLNEILRLAVVK